MNLNTKFECPSIKTDWYFQLFTTWVNGWATHRIYVLLGQVRSKKCCLLNLKHPIFRNLNILWHTTGKWLHIEERSTELVEVPIHHPLNLLLVTWFRNCQVPGLQLTTFITPGLWKISLYQTVLTFEIFQDWPSSWQHRKQTFSPNKESYSAARHRINWYISYCCFKFLTQSYECRTDISVRCWSLHGGKW